MILRFLPVFLMVLLSACMDFPEVWEGPPVETPTEIEEEAEEESSEGEGFDEEEGSVTESGSEPAPIPVRQPDPPVNSEETATTEPEETPTVTGTVVINELYYDAPGSDTDGVLFVELYGTPQLALSGYQVLFINGDNGGVTDVLALPDGSQIAADGFFVIADGRTGALDTTQVSAYDWIDNFDPQNGPDGILLLDPVGSVADSLVYG